jgi:hypothetical protein
MAEAIAPPLERPRRFHLDWLLPTLIRPRAAFARLAQHAGDAWLTPLLVITLIELVRVFAVGSVRQAQAALGQVQLPPDFQYWPPQMQEQFMQAQQATQGPIFIYALPAFIALMGVWIGWLLLAALLHLALTMLGGRSPTRNTLNVVAWAMLPFAVRALVTAGFALFTQSLVNGAGLSGFAPTDGTPLSAFLRELLIYVDIYLIWYVLLAILGARLASGLSLGKVIGGVLVTTLIVMALQALVGFGLLQFSGLSVLRTLY